MERLFPTGPTDGLLSSTSVFFSHWGKQGEFYLYLALCMMGKF